MRRYDVLPLFGIGLLFLAVAAGMAVAQALPKYSDRDLMDGFARTVFGAESGGSLLDRRRVKKYGEPVRVKIYNMAARDHSARVRRFIRLANASIKDLKIRTTRSDTKANMVVFLVERRDYRRVVRETLRGAGHDTRFLERNDCSAIASAHRYRIQQAFVYIVVDETQRAFHHCMVEEILQSLGPVNDDWRLKHSIFNDYSKIDRFEVFDWFLLNMLYDARIKPGMTEKQVRRILPDVIADVRKRLPRAVSLLRSQ